MEGRTGVGGWLISFPESFEKLTVLRLAAGEGLGEIPFHVAFVLKLR